MALLSLKLGGFRPALGTAGADLGKLGGTGLPMGGNLMLERPPASAPPMLGFMPIPIPILGLIPMPPMFMFMLPCDPNPPEFPPEELWGDMVGLAAKPIRCCCRARAFCIRSRGRPLTLAGGLRAFWRLPVTLELGLMKDAFWGSEMVRSDGTLRGMSSAAAAILGMISESELGGSKGVLASEDSSTEPGDAGLLSRASSKPSGEEFAHR